MFKNYSKDVVTEIDGDMKIIGQRDSKLCVLKDHNGPLYVGEFVDWEYVAAASAENLRGRYIPIYLDRQYKPCRFEDAVRGAVPVGGGSYTIWVKYKKPVDWYASIGTCFRELLKTYSPYSIEKFDKAGRFTIDQYLKMVVHDNRTNAAVGISFTRGIHITYTGNYYGAMRNVGGVAARTYADPKFSDDIYFDDNGCNLIRWKWNKHGLPSPYTIGNSDPEAFTISAESYKYIERDDDLSFLPRSIVRVAREMTDPVAYIMGHIKDAQELYAEAGEEMPKSVAVSFDALVCHLQDHPAE